MGRMFILCLTLSYAIWAAHDCVIRESKAQERMVKYVMEMQLKALKVVE